MEDNRSARPGALSGSRRVRRGAVLGLLAAALLLMVFASAASATPTPYDIRGEWSFELIAPKEDLIGEVSINKMEPDGEFSGTGEFAGGFVQGTITGTVSGSETSMTLVTHSSIGEITFVATGVAIDTVNNSFSGSGKSYQGGNEVAAPEVIGKRIKTYAELKEREEREQRETEEKLARSNIRGEWEITLETGPEKLEGIAFVTEEANSENEFSSSRATFAGVIPGTFSGTLKGSEADITMTTQAVGSFPAGTFASEAVSVTSAINPTSMTGSGTTTVGGFELPSTFTAKRIKTYHEVQLMEAAERTAKEIQEKEQQEKEALQAKEAQERAAREAKEQLEREAAQKSIAAKTTPNPNALLAVKPVGGAVAVSAAGALSLKLVNPNGAPVHGRWTLGLSGGVGAAAKRTSKGTKLGSASFEIAAGASKSLKLKLSHAVERLLKRRKTLHGRLTIVTEASGEAPVSKKYSLTLHAQAHASKG